MRKLLYLIVIILLGASCSSESKKTEAAAENRPISEEHLTLVKFEVNGMTCEGCENAIVASIKKLEGIQEATASHTAGQSLVKYDSSLVQPGMISDAIAGAGYEVTGFE